jgi:hypothetical protein
MNSRRKFVLQSSLATFALVAAKPMDALARVMKFSGLQAEAPGQFVLVHTASLQTLRDAETIRYIRKQPVSLLIEASTEKGVNLGYDAALTHEQDYEILDRNGYRSGIVYIHNEAQAKDAELLAATLKADHRCQLVVVVSELGFQKTSSMNDQALAAGSRSIDIIICAHATDFPAQPRIVANSQRSEVIVQAPGASMFGRIEINFDEQGRKRQVHLQARIPVAAA